MHPDWFDWLSLAVTVLAAVVPAWLAIALWRSDRQSSIRERRSAATREFTHLLATGDPVLVRFRDLGYFAETMGRGSSPLLQLIHRYMEWDRDEEREEERQVKGGEIQKSREPRLDLSVDANTAILRWNRDADYRADLTEVVLANGEIFPAEEDNRIISPTTRRAAEDEILSDPREYREWLAGTRLAPGRIRRRRLLERLRFWPTGTVVLTEPLNPAATKDYLDNDEIDGDEWLRERSTVPPEERDW
ncbi:hypothetical protein [Microbacterium abyssi]|uniref:hypothetical protein n=1 Tax=Microbacterium abyssi TaxID=2782166 RepID=UPI001886FBB6|nr:hypothetical protein [Microbacterium sp. A18JL241]